MIHPQPKPRDTIKRVKGRKDRAESKVKQKVRAVVAERDGDCRLKRWSVMGPCGGESEWAHLGAKKRARTRGMTPEERHTTAGSLMFCTTHHQMYDAGLIVITGGTRGADGPLGFLTSTAMVLEV